MSQWRLKFIFHELMSVGVGSVYTLNDGEIFLVIFYDFHGIDISDKNCRMKVILGDLSFLISLKVGIFLNWNSMENGTIY